MSSKQTSHIDGLFILHHPDWHISKNTSTVPYLWEWGANLKLPFWSLETPKEQHTCRVVVHSRKVIYHKCHCQGWHQTQIQVWYLTGIIHYNPISHQYYINCSDILYQHCIYIYYIYLTCQNLERSPMIAIQTPWLCHWKPTWKKPNCKLSRRHQQSAHLMIQLALPYTTVMGIEGYPL